MIRIRFHGSGAAAPLSAVILTAPRTAITMDADRVLAKRKVIDPSSHKGFGFGLSRYLVV
jgi:hypothetical protein